MCKRAVEEVWNIAEHMREVAPYNKVGEDEFNELTLNICDPDTDEGEWVSMQDIEQVGWGGLTERLATAMLKQP